MNLYLRARHPAGHWVNAWQEKQRRLKTRGAIRRIRPQRKHRHSRKCQCSPDKHRRFSLD